MLCLKLGPLYTEIHTAVQSRNVHRDDFKDGIVIGTAGSVLGWQYLTTQSILIRVSSVHNTYKNLYISVDDV